jgi:hypothetical protein
MDCTGGYPGSNRDHCALDGCFDDYRSLHDRKMKLWFRTPPPCFLGWWFSFIYYINKKPTRRVGFLFVSL